MTVINSTCQKLIIVLLEGRINIRIPNDAAHFTKYLVRKVSFGILLESLSESEKNEEYSLKVKIKIFFLERISRKKKF